jgi:hypothetical protein
MIAFIYESTIILGCAWCFYFLLLKKSCSFVFVRYYFLAALVLAMILPFIEIKTDYIFPVTGNAAYGTFYALLPMEAGGIREEARAGLSLGTVLWMIYILGLVLMGVRFAANLVRLLRKRNQGEIVRGSHGNIVLTEEDGLPYSFFRNIYMNRPLYEKSKEAEKLLLHEGAHCTQVHSVDILFSELVKTAIWFNPFVWLIARAMRLNHEYLADREVVETQDLNTYQLLLVDLELAHQTSYLASDFNYSFIKNRLAMMNNKSRGHGELLRKLAVLPLLMILLAILTFCENEPDPGPDPLQTMELDANDWWKPILEKHGITPRAYNNFESIFEMGSTNSIDENNVVSLTDAFFLIRKDKSYYAILRAPSATHDLKTGIISGTEGVLEAYDLLQDGTEPINQMEMKNFRYQLVEQKHDITADYLVLYENDKEKVRGLSGSFAAKDSLVINRDGK